MENTKENKKPLKEELKLILQGYKVVTKSFTKPVLLSKTISSIFNALSPFVNFYFSSLILNELVGERRKDELFRLVLLTISLNLIILLLKSLITRWKNYCESNEKSIMWEIYSDKLLSMDFADIENPKIQQQLSEIKMHQNGQGYGIRILTYNFEKLIQSFVQIILSITLVISLFKTRAPEGSEYSYLDSSFSMLLFILALFLSIYVAPYLRMVGGRVWQKASQVNNIGNAVFMYYADLAMDKEKGKDVRIYNQDLTIGGKFDYVKKMSVFMKYDAKWDSFATVVMNIVSGYIYLFVGMKAYAGAFEVGSVVLYVGAVTQLTTGASTFISMIGGLIKNNVFLENTLNFLNIENKKYQGTLSVEKREDNEYEIEFKNVSFKYPNTDTYALKNLNMKLHIGEKVAIVGMNGSGKTTMIKLLCRLYDADEGVITLNGIDIKKYNYDEYMDIFSVVFQDFGLLPFKLGENVATGVNYDKEKVMETLEKAGFENRVNTLPHGLDTYIKKVFEEEGVEVSGGEAQKIALARALYKDAPFIVLDEPTAALDPVAEFEIYSKFNEIVGDKTAIYISHRLSSCRFCDDIIVFDSGELIQRGKHEDLVLNKDGKYFELWNAQAQYYQ